MLTCLSARDPSYEVIPPMRQSTNPLDLWIGRELRRAYSATLAEPVPDDMLLLLDQLVAKP